MTARDVQDAMLPLRAVTPVDAARVGGKALNCARLLQAGFPVPDGFVVLPDSERPVTAAALEAALSGFPPNALFAVRSSGEGEDGSAQSFAGIHLTLLKVPREGLLAAIEACQASAASEAAQAYRRVHGLQQHGSMAVLVQQMVPADAAGVAFTVDPVSGDRSHMVISGAWGLGEAVVSGRVDPDEFRVARVGSTAVDIRLGLKAEYLSGDGPSTDWQPTPGEQRSVACLTQVQVQELAILLEQIERFYGAPQDVEWCRLGDAFFVVQSRPVTIALRDPGFDREWSRANALEGLPDLPLPQVSNAITTMVDRGMRQLFPEFWAPEAELGPLATTICGRPYYNLSQFRYMSQLTGAPAQRFIAQFGGVARPEDSVAAPLRFRALLRLLPGLLRLVRIRVTAGRSLASSLATVRKRLATLRAAQPEAMSDLELWENVRIPDDIGTMMGGAAASTGFLWTFLGIPCRRAAHLMDRLLNAHLAAVPKSSNNLQALRLVALAAVARSEPAAKSYFHLPRSAFDGYRDALAGTQFLRQFDAFLGEYGHCGNFEKDWSLPRFAEDQTPLLHALSLHVRSDAPLETVTLQTRLQQELADAWQEFERALGPRRSMLLRPLVKRALAGLAWNRFLREAGRFENSKLVAEGRRWHLALAGRMVSRGWLAGVSDYFYLTLPEIHQAIQSTDSALHCQEIVMARRRQHEQWLALEMPMVLRDSEVSLVTHARDEAMRSLDTESLPGTSVSRGCVTGEVVVIRSVAEFPKMKRSAIIVAPATDPSWTPLLTLASGVITEIGGTLSHSATLARELGIPAISNVTNATRLLRDGDRVTLDAVEGEVHRLSSADRA